MIKYNKIHKKYTENHYGYQLVLPLDLEVLIPEDDSVRLLDQILERLDYSRLLKANSYYGRKYSISSITLFKIMAYAYSQGIYSSRNIEKSCKRDINFKWLLKGAPVPDHNTIWRFVNQRLDECIKDLFGQLVLVLYELGQLQFENLFVDGTKIEANANRYTFVWRKATEKNEKKLNVKMLSLIKKLSEDYAIDFNDENTPLEKLKRAKGFLCDEKERIGMAFVHGKGSRKTQLQKDMEKTSEYIEKQEQYDGYKAHFGGRNSFSKTDPGATFMRMKEDHMRNAQLKPGYNIQFGVENEYVAGIYLSADRNDVNTLKSFLTDIRQCCRMTPENIIADAGYESEENYAFLKENGYTTYIKPQNHEQKKKKNYAKKYPGRVENMVYDETNDEYICVDGRRLTFLETREKESKSGYKSMVRVYGCADCSECRIRSKCTRSKYNKRVQVSPEFWKMRKESQTNITSKKGIILRMNRSIQAEGVIGVIKQDYGFRRFLRRGKENVMTEMILLCLGYNINKLHNKIQNDRLDQYLHKAA
jgi:transposase